jgi:protoporphyrinogen IX oxidase
MSAGGLYLWLKALHVVAVIAWMAGLLYLPRLFVYHCRAEAGSATSETFKIMERRLMGVIMTPAMLASWILGLALIGLLGADVLRDSLWLTSSWGWW